jgi:hypothetical protein
MTAVIGRSFFGHTRTSRVPLGEIFQVATVQGDLGGHYQCKEREQSQTRQSAATPPRNIVIIEGLLLASSHLGLVRTAFVFEHVGKHFTIPSRCLVDFQLPLSELFEFLKLRCELLSALLQILYLPVEDMQLLAGRGFEVLGNARSV